jgi:hypothetical protein
MLIEVWCFKGAVGCFEPENQDLQDGLINLAKWEL